MMTILLTESILLNLLMLNYVNLFDYTKYSSSVILFSQLRKKLIWHGKRDTNLNNEQPTATQNPLFTELNGDLVNFEYMVYDKMTPSTVECTVNTGSDSVPVDTRAQSDDVQATK